MSNIGSVRGPLPALLKANIFNQLDHRTSLLSVPAWST
jgi:hypothetical protein